MIEDIQLTSQRTWSPAGTSAERRSHKLSPSPGFAIVQIRRYGQIDKIGDSDRGRQLDGY
jgi:hypothetical protein